MYKSPNEPPFMPALPPSLNLRTIPSYAPLGTLIFTFSVEDSTPIPLHLEQVFSGILPLPPHFEQFAITAIWPRKLFCTRLSLPDPLHTVHVFLAPVSLPEPLQLQHLIFLLIFISYSPPLIASIKDIFILYLRSSPRLALEDCL